MSDHQNEPQKKSRAAEARVLFGGADAIRGGIEDIRKGLAILFLQDTAEGKQRIADGTSTIEKGVSQMRKKLTDECLIKTVDSYELMLSGIEFELRAVALLKEGLKRREANQTDDPRDIVQGLYLAEKGLADMERGETGCGHQDNREISRSIRESVKEIQASSRTVSIGLENMKDDRLKKGVASLADGIDGITKGVDALQDSLPFLRDEEPELVRLVLAGAQSIEEGHRKIEAGSHALNEPDSKRGCPICHGISQAEEGLRDVSEGVRNIRKGLSLLDDSDDDLL